MSLKTTELHVVSGLGAVFLTAAIFFPSLWLTTSAKADNRPPLEEMNVIEASLAMKKTSKSRQPKKEMQAPQPLAKPEGVSRDETKPVDPAKPDKPEPKPNVPQDPKTPVIPDRRNVDDDAPVGAPDETIGQFDGSKFGFADVSKGDPYLGALQADMEFTPPQLASGTQGPVGCVQLTADGKIPQIKFREETSNDLQPLAETALKTLKQKRNADPVPVPVHLLKALTTQWTCFRFNAHDA